MNDIPIPVLGFAAFSGTGKTTLLSALIPALQRRSINCGVIKHSHHDVEIDQPGKDSFRLRQAGARQVLFASPHRTFWIAEGDGETELPLPVLVNRLDRRSIDLILVEGFRDAAIPKIEVHRPALGRPLLCLQDPHVIALVCDETPAGVAPGMPLLPLDDIDGLADFVVAWMTPD